MEGVLSVVESPIDVLSVDNIAISELTDSDVEGIVFGGDVESLELKKADVFIRNIINKIDGWAKVLENIRENKTLGSIFADDMVLEEFLVDLIFDYDIMSVDKYTKYSDLLNLFVSKNNKVVVKLNKQTFNKEMVWSMNEITNKTKLDSVFEYDEISWFTSDFRFQDFVVAVENELRVGVPKFDNTVTYWDLLEVVTKQVKKKKQPEVRSRVDEILKRVVFDSIS